MQADTFLNTLESYYGKEYGGARPIVEQYLSRFNARYLALLLAETIKRWKGDYGRLPLVAHFEEYRPIVREELEQERLSRMALPEPEAEDHREEMKQLFHGLVEKLCVHKDAEKPLAQNTES